jgi:hypothetical protein
MTPPLDGRPRAEQEEDRRTAFGLALSIDPRISIQGLGPRTDSVSAVPPSHVRLDARGLDQRWKALATTPARVREHRFGGTLRLSIDFAEPAGYLLWAQGFGRVLISPDGAELLCEPDPVNRDWASLLSAQALPLAATLRGLEVFHASGVVLGGRALLFSGPPGAGKSSLAAALVRDDAQLLSDDVVALTLSEGVLTAYPGSVVLQLRAAEEERLSVDARTQLGSPASSSAGKQRYVSVDVPGPAPLGGLFLLERSAEEPPIQQLSAVDPFELIASTFNLSVRTPARLERQLDVVSAIASSGLAYRLRVQPGVDAAQLASIVQAQLTQVSS